MNLNLILKALGEPMRLSIFQALLERKHCVRSLSKRFGISESAISQHLKIMREADLVFGKKYSYHTHYFPQQEALDFLIQEFSKMKDKPSSCEEAREACNCEYRKEDKES